ncbi:hypothetical protein ALNOE001_15870 [Candidatus Methanobinarius endosymbioticus]|uniref:Uncharacterized protein n=1 Tax=Candidatus Methanobinarius endosymbioticus TaxID=2006182 RepID=A0A366M972_9EURY|nr:hypothetical protein ALNOE001_15870 [Candidatus Methanobinarius endosymbioticus]
MVIKKVTDAIEKMDGIIKIEQLTNEDIRNMVDIEANRANDLIPVINEGLKECFRRDISIVLFKNSHFRTPSTPTLLLITEDGKILGHDIFTKEDKERFEKDENVHFLSNDFVIFKEKHDNRDSNPKKQYFLLPPVEFNELDHLEMVTDVISSSPSTHSDIYLKKKYRIPEDPKIATIIVSFSIKENKKNKCE